MAYFYLRISLNLSGVCEFFLLTWIFSLIPFCFFLADKNDKYCSYLLFFLFSSFFTPLITLPALLLGLLFNDTFCYSLEKSKFKEEIKKGTREKSLLKLSGNLLFFEFYSMRGGDETIGSLEHTSSELGPFLCFTSWFRGLGKGIFSVFLLYHGTPFSFFLSFFLFLFFIDSVYSETLIPIWYCLLE